MNIWLHIAKCDNMPRSPRPALATILGTQNLQYLDVGPLDTLINVFKYIMLVNCNHYLGNFIENTALNNTVEISELGTLLRLVHTSRCSQLTLRSRSIAIEMPGRTDFISITRQQLTYSS